MKLKQQLYSKCQEVLNSRLEVIQNSIKDIEDSFYSETKSSAGDKHETGRAMLQLEREKAGNQLAELKKLNETLQRINVNQLHNKVTLGSIVKTTELNYFISLSVGEIILGNEIYFGISMATPMGKLLLSKSVGDLINFRSKEFTIVDIE